jgi:TonB-dependent receptor
MRASWRHAAWPAALLLALPAQARTLSFAIPEGPLSGAIASFSLTTGIQVMADPAALGNRRTRGVHGRLGVEQAMALLLRGTGLASRRRGDVILIVVADRSVRRLPAPQPTMRKPSRPAVAKAAAPQDESPITIVGHRIADERASALKARARNIVDAVSSDEVRRLPDLTIVDALRRIPGVSVVPIADNEHPRDVPIAPVVRGLTQDYNNVTINGLPIASTGIPDAGSNSAVRGARLDILPASMVSHIMVIKTFTPDLDPNAIGGAIDLSTRSAFEDGGRPFVSAEAGIAATSDHGEVQRQSPFGAQAAFTASDTFGADRRFGLVLSANYQHLDNNSNVHGTSDSGYLNFYGNDGRQAPDGSFGNGIAVPQQDRYWYNASNRWRWGVTGRAEADLDHLRLSAMAGAYRYIDGYTRNEILIEANDAQLTGQTPTSGHFATGSSQVGYRRGTTRSDTQLLQVDADWTPNPKDEVLLRGGISRAAMTESYRMVKFAAGMNAAGTVVGTPRLAFDYDTRPFQYSFNVPTDAYYDLSLYSVGYWRHREREAASEVDALRVDWRHNIGEGDVGLGFAGGAAWTRTSYAYGYDNAEYRSTDRGLTLAGAGYIGTARLPFSQNGLRLLVIDPARAWAMFAANQDSIFATDADADDLADDFTHAETAASGYALLRYADGPVELLGGARLEHTAVETNANVAVEDRWERDRTGSRYLQLLPSLLLNYRPSGALRLRAAYSRTIGRPSYQSYAPHAAIEFGNDAEIGNPQSQGVRVVSGNPGIKPRLSDNGDLSVEWTLPRRFDGMVSAALFYKAIDREIFAATTMGYTFEGVDYANAEVTRLDNATAAHIAGVELSATIGSLSAVAPLLNHVGLSANWTLLNGAVTVPNSAGATRTVDRLVGQPSEIGNATLFYSEGGFELRGAVNWTGTALRSIAPDTAWQDVYWAPRRQVDAQARYHFGSGLSVIVDVANLTQTRLTSVTGPGRRWLKDSYSVPRTVWLSLHWSLGK